MNPDPQLELPFGAGPGTTSGLDRWHAEREDALRQLSHDLGLPLGHRVEIMLRDGVRLIGILRLADDQLWVQPGRDLRIELRIDACTFTPAEIVSCLRLD